jgi:hypothetical protein
MHDLRLAVGLIGFLSVAIFSATFRLLRKRSKRFLDFIAAVIVLLLFAYVYLVWGQLWIVQWIPLPSVIVLANWFPLFLGALAAVVWLRLEPAGVRRKLPILIMMIAAAAYSVMVYLPIRPPECQDKWAEPPEPMTWPVCLQTTPSTCSAAAAATILNTLGIRTTEQEMARYCLTRSGTTWLGLYHGLATKLQGEGHSIEFFQSDSSHLAEMTADGPLLLCCMLEEDIARRVPEYVSEGGWIPGLAHSVVYFGQVGDRHIIGDPSRGYEAWTTLEMNLLWTGTGLRAVRSE